MQKLSFTLVLLFTAGLLGPLGCDSGADDANSSSANLGAANDGTGTGQQGTDEQTTGNQTGTSGSEGLTCDLTSIPSVDTSMGLLAYDNYPEVKATKLSGNGCLTSLSLIVEQEAGCRLDLTLDGSQGAWNVTAGSLGVDASCGLDIAESEWGNYSLDQTTSTGALLDPPTISGDGATCLDGAELSLTGLVQLTSGVNEIEIDLNALHLAGDVLSESSAEGSCPEAVTPCENVGCGDDAYGVSCGGCEAGDSCVSSECVNWNCPPGGPFGTHPGESMTDVVLRDCDDNEYHLHDLCGAGAGFFNLLAGW